MNFLNQVITVTQLNTYIKSILEENRLLKNIFVKGEISNFKKHLASGHMYFTLKDENASIACVMFKGYSSKLAFEMKDGLKVIISGRISIYEKSGNMQIYALDVQPDGIGALALAFLQLKEKLQEEGLFDEKYKKSVPKFPKRIGVVTSKTGAVIKDIINVASRRYPLAEILLYPTNVQGESAPEEISLALKHIDTQGCDVVITGRGGGSLEDLWAFNTEIVARSLFDMKTPVISAVGHETDVTIADFVADLRAATPSAATEMATPSQDEIRLFLKNSLNAQNNYMKNIIKMNMDNIASFKKGNGFFAVNQKIANSKNTLDKLALSTKTTIQNIIQTKNESYSKEIARLESLSPLLTMTRGYTLVENKDGIVDSIKKVSVNDELNIKLKDGTIKSKVTKIIEKGDIHEKN